MADDKEVKTSLLPDIDIQELLLKQTVRQLNTGSLGSRQEIILKIGESEEQVSLAEEMHCMLGRFSKRKPSGEAIDLSPYNALEKGISRIHAQLHVDENRLYITDLDSTNGTFLHGKRLKPHTPTLLRSGDDLLLGKLAIQVVVR